MTTTSTASRQQTPSSRLAGISVVSLLIVAALYFLRTGRHGRLPFEFGGYRLDLDIYRLGSLAWLHGHDPYGVLPPAASGARLPFTYPPISAVLMTPLSVVSYPVANVILTVLSLVALVASVYVVTRRYHRTLGRRSVVPLVAGASAVLLLCEPMRSTLMYGQINALLMAAVVFDCLGTRRRWCGVLVGLAAAVKLTPAGFVLFFVLRRDWPSLARAVLSFAYATALGAVFAPGPSREYWTHVLFDARRVGNLDYTSNQSVAGLLARLGISGFPHIVAWLAAAAVVATLTVAGMRRALGADDLALALGLNGVACLLLSPISWSHHWVWLELVALSLCYRSIRRCQPVTGLLVGFTALVMFVAPHWLLPHAHDQELTWSAWQQLAGNSYVECALLLLAVAALGWFTADSLTSECTIMQGLPMRV